MTIVILPSARDDLAEGFAFYQKQQEGLGAYFLETLFSDIDSLRLYAGIHRKVFGFHRLLSRRFPYAIYYSKELTWPPSERCWTAAATRDGSEHG